MRTIILAVISLVVLASCATAEPIMTPSGESGYKIWCEQPSMCYDKAAEVCPNGYDIEAKDKDYWGMGDVDGNLIIKCKE